MFLTIKLCTYAEQIIYIKMDLALNNRQRLICHKTQQTKPNQPTIGHIKVINLFPSS